MAFEGLGWTRLLSYTVVSLCVIFQTVALKSVTEAPGKPGEKPSLQVVASTGGGSVFCETAHHLDVP